MDETLVAAFMSYYDKYFIFCSGHAGIDKYHIDFRRSKLEGLQDWWTRLSIDLVNVDTYHQTVPNFRLLYFEHYIRELKIERG